MTRWHGLDRDLLIVLVRIEIRQDEWRKKKNTHHALPCNKLFNTHSHMYPLSPFPLLTSHLFSPFYPLAAISSVLLDTAQYQLTLVFTFNPTIGAFNASLISLYTSSNSTFVMLPPQLVAVTSTANPT